MTARSLTLFPVALIVALPAAAQVPPGEPIEVDVELVLAVDVSRSMSPPA